VNPEEQPGSLADQAASWVPPWQRPVARPAPEAALEADGAIDEDLADLIGDRTDEDAAPIMAEVVDVIDVEEDVEPDEVDDDFEDAEPEDVEPEDVEPEDVEPEDVEPEDVDPGDVKSQDVDDDVAAEEVEPGEVDYDVAAEVDEPGEADESVEPGEVDESGESDEVVAAVVVVEGETAANGDVPDAFVAEVDADEPDAELVDSVLADVAMAQAAGDEEPGADPGEPVDLKGALEAILLVVDEPVSEETLAQVLNVPVAMVTAQLAATSAEYTEAGRGFDLRRIAGGWRLYTRGEFATYVERFVLDGQSVRLTQAALETLAVIAYRQPVTRSRISAIRGVNCDGTIRTLVTRGLIEECGTQPESGAFLYRTTSVFLEKLGLDSVDELPPLAPFLPDDVNGFADAQR
jgi:segregation and condensation protein B